MSRASTVDVNGYAGKRIRILLGFEVPEVAEKTGVTANYLYRVESGRLTRISTTAFRKWMDALLIADPRELMASPHTQKLPEENGNGNKGAA